MSHIHPGNLQCFLEVYKEFLIESYTQAPEDYAWSASEFDQVFERMSRAIERGSFNKDSLSFKKTCKKLKIKHTYKAINEFISLSKIEESQNETNAIEKNNESL